MESITKKGVSKFRPRLVKDIVEMCYEGFSNHKIALYLGISDNTMSRWRKKYPYLKELMEKARKDGTKELLETGLRQLAKGSKDKIISEKYVTYRKITRLSTCELTGETIEKEELIPVERTETIKEKAPDSKAIEILARKYYKDLDPKAEERQVNSKILDGFTMRELQEARKNNPIDLGGSIEVEYTEQNA